MEGLQHHQQHVEEVVAHKRFKHFHGQHQSGMDDPVINQIIGAKLKKVFLTIVSHAPFSSWSFYLHQRKNISRVSLTCWGKSPVESRGRPQQTQRTVCHMFSSIQCRSWTSWRTAKTTFKWLDQKEPHQSEHNLMIREESWQGIRITNNRKHVFNSCCDFLLKKPAQLLKILLDSHVQSFVLCRWWKVTLGYWSAFSYPDSVTGFASWNQWRILPVTTKISP